MISVVISNKTHMQKKHKTPRVACTDLNRKTDEKEKIAQRKFAQPTARPHSPEVRCVQPSPVKNKLGMEALMFRGKNNL